MRIGLILIFSLFEIKCAVSQSNFIVEGKTNLIENGKAVLLLTAPDSFYSDIKNKDTVAIINHRFKITGFLRYPQEFRLMVSDKSQNQITELFFLDSGLQTLIVDSTLEPHNPLDFGSGIKIRGSRTSDEFYKGYLPLFNPFLKDLDSYFKKSDKCSLIKDVEKKALCIVESDSIERSLKQYKDSIFFKYVISKPTSEILPWLLNELVSYNGFKSIYKKAFDAIRYSLPEPITDTLERILVFEKRKAVGSHFPLSNFINSQLGKNYLQKNEYTLIDFWFAACRPCIHQFSLLKDVYSKYNQKGFDVVAISIDRKSNMNKYKKVIREQNYKWKQILDTGGLKAKSLGILKFPSNFLLDRTGKIIGVDVNPLVLDIFLKKHPKKVK